MDLGPLLFRGGPFHQPCRGIHLHAGRRVCGEREAQCLNGQVRVRCPKLKGQRLAFIHRHGGHGFPHGRAVGLGHVDLHARGRGTRGRSGIDGTNAQGKAARSLGLRRRPRQRPGPGVDLDAGGRVGCQLVAHGLARVGIGGLHAQRPALILGRGLCGDGLEPRGHVAPGDGIEGGGRRALDGDEVVAGAVGVAPEGDVVGLRPEGEAIHRRAIRREQPHGLAAAREAEAHVEPTLRNVGLADLAIGPHEEEAAGGNHGAGRQDGGRLVRKVVRQEVPGHVRRRGSGIVELDPVVEVAVGGVGKHGRVRGEDLVDDDLDLGHEGVVGLAGRRHVEGPSRIGVAIRHGPEPATSREGVIFEGVEHGHGGGVALKAGQDDGALGGRETERGVGLAWDGLGGLVVEPHHERAAGGHEGVGRKLPALRGGEAVAQPQARDVGDGGGGVEQLDEGVGVAGVVHDGRGRRGDDLVEPDRGEGGERGADGVVGPGRHAVGGVGGGGGPVGGATRVLRGVDQLERRPPAIGVGGPRRAVEVTHPAERDVGTGRQQAEAFAVVVEVARELVEDRDGSPECGAERGTVGGEDEEATGEDGGVGGEGVADAFEPVAGEVEGDGGVAVEELDEGGARGGGVVVDLVEDDPVARLGHGAGKGDGDGIGRTGGLARRIERGQHEGIGGLGERDGHAERGGAGPVDGVTDAVDGDVGDEERGGSDEGGDGLGGGEVVAAIGRDAEGGVGGGVELVEDIGSTTSHVVGDAGEGGEAGDVVLLVEEPVALDDGDELGGRQRAVRGAMEGAPQHPLEGRGRVEPRVGDGVLAARESRRRAVPKPEHEVDVPGQEHRPSSRLAIEVHVLAHVVGPRVPVARHAMEGKHAHPFLDIGLLQHPAGEARVEGRVEGGNEVEDRLVVAFRELLGAAFPVPSVPRQLGLTAGRERLHGGLDRGEVAVVVLELEPDRDLVEVALAVVRIVVLGVRMVGLLEVLHDVGEAGSVDIEELVLGLQRRDAHARRDPVRHPAAEGRVLDAAVARLGEETLAHPMQQVVVGHARRDVPGASVVGAALVPEDGLVDDAGVAIDDGAAAVGVVEGVAARRIAVRRRAPEMRVGKAGEGHGLVPSDQALVQGRAGRPHGFGRPPVRCADREGHQGAGALPRNRAREDSVGRHPIPVQPVVPHGYLRGGCRGVQPVPQRHRDHAIGVRRPGHDAHGLADPRQDGRMRDGMDGRPDVGQASGVGFPGRAKVSGDRQRRGIIRIVAT